MTRILPESSEQNGLIGGCVCGWGGIGAAPQQSRKNRLPVSRKIKRWDENLAAGGTAMITLSMINFLFGAALGQRFNVVVLIPAMAIVLVLSVGAGVTHAQSVWSIVLMAATAAVCLQFGYFTGIGVRHLLLAARQRGSSPLTPAETSVRHAAR
jgi:hypothetical protein